VKNVKGPWGHAQIGLELAVAVLAGFFCGYYADRRFGTPPWLMLSGAAFGMFCGFYLLFRDVSGDK